jgi:pimeloyl-ACP methyl ester carboxylesterase
MLDGLTNVEAFTRQKTGPDARPILYSVTELVLISRPDYLESVARSIVSTTDLTQHILVGYSIGGLYAAYLSLRFNVHAIVIDSPLWVLPPLTDMHTGRIINIYFEDSPFFTMWALATNVPGGVTLLSRRTWARRLFFHAYYVYVFVAYCLHFSHLFDPCWVRQLRVSMDT